MIYLIFLCELSVFAVLSFSLCNILYSFPDFLSSKFINLLLKFYPCSSAVNPYNILKF